MRLNAVAKTMAASAAALLIAGCGGGGSDPGAVVLSGTAATGAALANASVEVKCAAGSGTATTSTSGGYSVTVSGGKLPCIVKVSGTTGGGVAVTLHSVAESGTAAGGNTNATANVTPITEMIVAQLMAALPADAFATFNPGQVTQAALEAAAETIVAALKTAGIDLAGIDPLKDELVPPSGNNAGNAYDQLLDKLGDTVGPEALPLVVSQIANAATTKSSEGLNTAIQAVAGGAMEGCPVAVSGTYRSIEYWGKTVVRKIDFKAGTLKTGDRDPVAITLNPDKPCTFTATGPVGDQTGEIEVAFGPQGIGTFRSRFINPDTLGVVGWIFPVQSHGVAAVTGEWDFLQSGYIPGDPVSHYAGKLAFGSDGKVGVCEYDEAFVCQKDDEGTMSIVAGSDGGIVLQDSLGEGAKLYAYKSPNGALTVFGTTNPEGINTMEQEQTSIVATRLSAQTLPALNSVSKYNETQLFRFFDSGTSTYKFGTDPISSNSTTVIAVDSAAGSFTRKRASDGREDTQIINKPITGTRYREAGTLPGTIQIPLAGATVIINSDPTRQHFYAIAVGRP